MRWLSLLMVAADSMWSMARRRPWWGPPHAQPGIPSMTSVTSMHRRHWPPECAGAGVATMALVEDDTVTSTEDAEEDESEYAPLDCHTRVREHSSKFTGVHFAQRQWQANVRVTVARRQPKTTFLGASASEEQAAERVSAGAYILGDRCAHRSTCVRAEACVRQGHRGAHPADGLAHPCAAAQVHQQGALGPLPQPGACARSGTVCTLTRVSSRFSVPRSLRLHAALRPLHARCAFRAGAGRGGAGAGQGGAAGGAGAEQHAGEVAGQRAGGISQSSQWWL